MADRPLCACGCGQPVNLASANNTKHGYVKGRPYKYLRGHHLRGSNHHGWVGGRKAHTRGYVRVLAPDHPRATADGYVLEHILVAEEQIGRALLDGEVVHHINGNPADNRPENLRVFASQAEHLRHHNYNRTGARHEAA